MKNLLKNKIFIILGLLFILCSLNSKVFAVSPSELSETDLKKVIQLGYKSINDNGYNAKDFTKYLISNQGICYFTDNSTIDTIPWSGSILVKAKNNFSVWFDFDTLQSTGIADNMNNQIGNPWDMVYIRDVFYSSFDICKDGKILFTKNIDFFQVAPVGRLATMVTLEEAKEITTTLAGLTKLLIPLLICLLGLWKGLQVLLRILRMA